MFEIANYGRMKKPVAWASEKFLNFNGEERAMGACACLPPASLGSSSDSFLCRCFVQACCGGPRIPSTLR
jgi:hypothetical protein